VLVGPSHHSQIPTAIRKDQKVSCKIQVSRSKSAIFRARICGLSDLIMRQRCRPTTRLKPLEFLIKDQHAYVMRSQRRILYRVAHLMRFDFDEIWQVLKLRYYSITSVASTRERR
jgi:hypothetical protein